MLTCIGGNTGTGKTVLMVMFANHFMTGPPAAQRVALSRMDVMRLNAGGYNYTLPDGHVVFSDIPITAVMPGGKLCASWDIDGFQIGIKNKYFPTVAIPPYSLICLDEAQRYYNSRVQSSQFPPEVSRFYEIHRHNHLDIIMTCQRPALIDKTIRGIMHQFIFIERFDVRYDAFGRVSGCVWHCVRLKSSTDAETYSDSRILPKDAVNTVYTYAGNIFLRYDSYCCFPLHYAGRSDEDFVYDPARFCSYDYDDIEDYGERHNMAAPPGYYLNTRKGAI